VGEREKKKRKRQEAASQSSEGTLDREKKANRKENVVVFG